MFHYSVITTRKPAELDPLTKREEKRSNKNLKEAQTGGSTGPIIPNIYDVNEHFPFDLFQLLINSADWDQKQPLPGLNPWECV